MFLHISSAIYLEDYKVKVSFNNGREGIADLSGALKRGIFKSLQSKAKFSRLMLDKELETIVWENGADLAPEYVYFQTFKDDIGLQEQFKQWGYLD